jgi:hypothetical protein
MKKIISLIIIIISASIVGCGNTPLFDKLAETKISVIVKGTYESNAPRDWIKTDGMNIDILNDDSMTVCPPSGADTTSLLNYYKFPTTFKMDIAELKLDGDRFANHRMLYENATADNAPLFDGTGVFYKNDDVKPKKTYSTLNVYFRKLIFDNSNSFNASTGSFISTIKSYFDEVKSEGYDYNPIQVLSKYDTLLNDYTAINRVFPLAVPVSGGFVFDNQHDYVLELRIVVKNFEKRYEKIETVDDVVNSYHFFAFSDLFHDVRAGDAYIGGNMLAGARWYIKGQTVTISGTAPGGSGYVIAIPAGDDITKYNPPTITRPADYYSPRIPIVGGSDAASMLEYYVDKQKYNYDYSNSTNFNYMYVAQHNLAGNAVTTDTLYDNTWTDFNTKASAYRVPPLATYTSSGAYTLTEVQAGQTYDLYWATDANVGMGDLPGKTSPGFKLLTTVDVPMALAGTVIYP